MVKPVVVVGAGVGGLSAAVRLAASGRRVVVMEKNADIGGKMGEVRADGFRWDTGPSVITMRHVVEELFASAGRRLDDYLKLLPIEPLTRYFYPDGTVLDLARDLPRTLEQISRLDERDVEGYLAFLRYAARLHRVTGPVFIYDQPPTWRSVLRVSPLDMLSVDAWRTMNGAIRGFVHSPHMRRLLGRFATYVGASPYHAPATLNVIAHVELNGGVWYPEGGIYAITRALGRLAAELGVEIRAGCGVEQIRVADGAVRGVIVGDGGMIEADAVIANVDVTTTYEKLLPDAPQREARLKRLKRLESSCSGFIILLGVEGRHPRLAHHNIFFSADYRREFEDIFKKGIAPSEPTIYVAVTSKTTPGDAPEDGENWFVLVNAPPTGPAYDWSSAGDYRDLVLSRLAGYGFDVRGRIRVERIITPADLERMTGARRGALYGASSNSPLAAFRRPHNRAPDVRGLYFAGGTAHPGGGVPMVMLSGRVAAGMVMDDFPTG
ncbi:MAG: phytoene desaturase [Chloroflexi bacterium]|nr:phytoene desaturase [Chloroflexota bacterium]